MKTVVLGLYSMRPHAPGSASPRGQEGSERVVLRTPLLRHALRRGGQMLLCASCDGNTKTCGGRTLSQRAPSRLVRPVRGPFVNLSSGKPIRCLRKQGCAQMGVWREERMSGLVTTGNNLAMSASRATVLVRPPPGHWSHWCGTCRRDDGSL